MNHYEPVKDSHSDASLEVRPDNRQHLMGGNFTLRCSVNGGNSTGWILRRHQGAKNISGCLQLNGKESIDRPEDCHFIDINSKNSGLYWCENTAENKTSNTINITVVSCCWLTRRSAAGEGGGLTTTVPCLASPASDWQFERGTLETQVEGQNAATMTLWLKAE
ncbi:hypothetical protein DPX16_8343 [Anabarilius grahami]|uniref:Ig-like domain-containing protein n=1 Tax=Anabarilius grahami TaxID=495550 RepID=A0A3N0ZAN1_ANAGA|nr:hypothetical protein DPX16_8343 [Anabarilius grahami]